GSSWLKKGIDGTAPQAGCAAKLTARTAARTLHFTAGRPMQHFPFSSLIADARSGQYPQNSQITSTLASAQASIAENPGDIQHLGNKYAGQTHAWRKVTVS